MRNMSVRIDFKDYNVNESNVGADTHGVTVAEVRKHDSVVVLDEEDEGLFSLKTNVIITCSTNSNFAKFF
jgi:hypothetical protein